jgi:hypothetical protein
VRRLFHEHRFVLVVAQAGEVAVIGPVEELAAQIRPLPGEHVALPITTWRQNCCRKTSFGGEFLGPRSILWPTPILFFSFGSTLWVS